MPVVRVAGTLAALSVAIALAGCGSSSETTAGQPALARGLANALADKSDEIAAALEGNDECGAARLADELKDAVDAAIANGQVPAALRGELERTSTDLQNEVNCPEEHGKEDKGEKKGHDEGGETTTQSSETTTLGTTVSTTTEGNG
jgi:hypothetical protein